MTLALLVNMGFAGGAAAAATRARRGRYARGRARARGRRLWWLVLMAASGWLGA